MQQITYDSHPRANEIRAYMLWGYAYMARGGNWALDVGPNMIANGHVSVIKFELDEFAKIIRFY